MPNQWKEWIREVLAYSKAIWNDVDISLRSLRRELVFSVFVFIVADLSNYYESGRTEASRIDYETWISGLRPAILTFCALFLLRLLLVAPFQIWKRDQREQHRLSDRIRPKLEVTTGVAFPWVQSQQAQQPGQHIKAPGYLYTYRIGLRSIGVEPVKSVRVRLTAMTPHPTELIPMPCYLEIMNDRQVPRRESVEVQQAIDDSQRDGIFIDVVRFFDGDEGQQWMGIAHIATGVNTSVHPQRYQLKLTISSDNGGETIERWYSFDPSKNANDRFQIEEGA